jgi:hypothetical protein
MGNQSYATLVRDNEQTNPDNQSTVTITSTSKFNFVKHAQGLTLKQLSHQIGKG